VRLPRRLVAVLAVVVVSGCTTAHRPTASPAPSARPNPLVDVYGKPIATPPRVDRFQPAALSFVSQRRGWVLGAVGCYACAALRTTTDGGATWSSLRPPAELLYYGARPQDPRFGDSVSDLLFVDETVGYAFGPGLEFTRDGGRTWTTSRLHQVGRLVRAKRDVYAVVTRTATDPTPAGVWRSSIGSDAWRQLPVPATGTRRALALAAEGPTIALLEEGAVGPGNTVDDVGRLWISTDRGDHWTHRTVPCRPDEGGATVISIALGHARNVLLDCFDHLQSSQQIDTQHHLYGSSDAGATWVRLADPTRHGAPALMADNGAGRVVITTESGEADTLVTSADGGRHWTSAFSSGGSFSGWSDLRFLNESFGFVVGPAREAQARAYRTTDGGRTWIPFVIR